MNRKIGNLLFVVVSLLIQLPAYAVSEKPVVKPKLSADFLKQVQEYARDYHFSQQKAAAPTLRFLDSSHPVHPQDRCDEPHESCLNAVCSRMSSHRCDDRSEVDRVLEICRGVDGNCITQSCQRMSSYQCDDFDEVAQIARACPRAGYNCVESICSKMSSYQCDDRAEVVRVINICHDVYGSCIDAVCARLSSHQCDDIAELESVAGQCRGRN